MSNPMPSPALFFDTISAFQRTEALRAAIDLDVFTRLAEGKQTVQALAEACNASERGIRILADYLTIIGILHKESDRYKLTSDSKFFLNRGSPAYLGGTMEFLLTPNLKECFQSLTQAVRHGGTAISEEGTVSYDNPIWVSFARAMGPLMQMPAKLLAGLVEAETSRPLRVLDIAAGHGLFGIAIAERFANSKVTALDWPNVLAVATENAHRAGLESRHSLLPGSAFEVDWGGPFDLILFTNFLHHFDTLACEKLAAKAFNALSPDGQALTLDFIPEPDRVSPPSTAGFALTMLATTAHGDAYTFEEYDTIFSKAGFTRNVFHTLPPTSQQAVVSYKA